MSAIGRSMFKGAGIGAGVGAVAGGVTGGVIAHGKIKKVPMETVTLDSYKKPIYEEKIIGHGTDYNFQEFPYNRDWAVSGKVAKRNSDGTLQMKKMPQKDVTGHGKPIKSQKVHDVREAVGVDTTSYPVTYEDSNGNTHTVNRQTHSARYRSTGETWTEPTVKFEHGVNTAAHILGGAAIGAVAGAAGGALVGAAVHKAYSN